MNVSDNLHTGIFSVIFYLACGIKLGILALTPAMLENIEYNFEISPIWCEGWQKNETPNSLHFKSKHSFLF